MRAFSSAMVASLSSNFGASTPEMRASPFLAASQAIWICGVNGSMSGASRYCVSAVGSNLRAVGVGLRLVQEVGQVAQHVLEHRHAGRDIEIVMGDLLAWFVRRSRC